MNKPVAYVTGVRQFDSVSVDTVLKVGTPLYTHPVKELTQKLDALLCSVLGEAYLGEEKEQELAKAIRQQYTHPVKELTDEEIRLLADEYLFINRNCGEIEGYNQFAKAILRKAQEK